MFGINNYIKFMKYFFAVVFFFLTTSYSFGLPKCNGDYSKHCSGVVMHPNGEKYIGEIKNYKYHGKGTYLFINGNTYTGDFNEGIQSGRGIFKFINGDSYEGDFKNGLFHGQGTGVFRMETNM